MDMFNKFDKGAYMNSGKGHKVKILFVRLSPSSFVQNDLKILKKYFDIKVVDFVFNVKYPKNSFKTIWDMITGILWADLTFSWFADVHAYWTVRLSKIFRKKSIVVIGGYETAKINEIEYGALLDPTMTGHISYVLKNSDSIISLTELLKEEAMENYGVDGSTFKVIPTGFDYKVFKSKGKKENLVFTAALGDTCNRIKLKGIDTFVNSAKFLPDVKFVVNGITGDALEKLKKVAPSNVDFIGPISFEELVEIFQKSKVYCQLSMREGLPTAVCEAMLCECVPVGTDRYGIPLAIGDTGFYAPYGDEKATAEAIKKALKSNNGKKARERIKTLFPKEIREKRLLELFKELDS
jgi:glycosyltransferase involved in cell wall biosynthesis